MMNDVRIVGRIDPARLCREAQEPGFQALTAGTDQRLRTLLHQEFIFYGPGGMVVDLLILLKDALGVEEGRR